MKFTEKNGNYKQPTPSPNNMVAHITFHNESEAWEGRALGMVTHYTKIVYIMNLFCE